MIEIVDPLELAEEKRFKQLKAINQAVAKGEIQQDALQEELQWHIIYGINPSHGCFLFRKSTGEWATLAPLLPTILSSPQKIRDYINEILAHEWLQGRKQFGMVLHMAEEFATTEVPLSSQPDEEEQLEIRRSLIVNPLDWLKDSTLDAEQMAWRALLYDGNKRPPYAVAVTVNRHYEEFLAKLTAQTAELGLQTSTRTLCSALTLIAKLPYLLDWQEGQDTLVLLTFTPFTALVVISKLGDITFVRAIQGRANPGSIANAVQSATINHELEQPRIVVFNPNSMAVTSLVNALNTQLKPVQPIELLQASEQISLCSDLSGFHPAAALCVDCVELRSPRLAESTSFKRLADEQWGLAEFNQPLALQRVFLPNKHENAFYKTTNSVQKIIILLGVLLIGTVVYKTWSLTQSKEWKYNPKMQAQLANEKKELEKRKSSLELMEKLLLDRSRQWTVMELLGELFADNPHIVVESFSYNAPAAKLGVGEGGYTRTFSIRGSCDREGEKFINSLGDRQVLVKYFNNVYERTGDASFDCKPDTRLLSASPSTKAASSRGASPFNTSFDLVITQTFDAKDDLKF